MADVFKGAMERKMHSIEKMEPTRKQGRSRPCVLSSICADIEFLAEMVLHPKLPP